MNIYEDIAYNLKKDIERYKSAGMVQINPNDYKEFRTKSFEEVQETAKKYGLFLTYDKGTNIFYDTHPYIFSFEPLNPKNGMPISVTVD